MRTLSHLSTAVQRITLRAAVLFVIALIAPVLLVSTFASSAGGAVLLGYDPALDWTLPVALDLVALVGTVVASVAVGKTLRRYALVLVYVPLALSWAANAIDHLERMGERETVWIVASILMAGAPPVSLVAMLHLAIMLNHDRVVTIEKDGVTEGRDAVTVQRDAVTPDRHTITQTVTPQVEPVTEPIPVVIEEELEAEPELEELTVAQLREVALREGVSIRGSKAEIASRIRDRRDAQVVTA